MREKSKKVEELRSKFTQQFNKLPQEVSELAKSNFDYKFAIQYPMPDNSHEAVMRGFNWGKSPEKLYFWNQVYDTELSRNSKK